jgi:GT2 family glycosyltransferase
MIESVGIGIITCDRPDFFKKCRRSIKQEWYDRMVVINDGKGPLFDARAPIIQTTGKEGVGRAKNRALKHLLDDGCEHIFLVEDDVIFKENAFQAYIDDQ